VWNELGLCKKLGRERRGLLHELYRYSFVRLKRLRKTIKPVLRPEAIRLYDIWKSWVVGRSWSLSNCHLHWGSIYRCGYTGGPFTKSKWMHSLSNLPASYAPLFDQHVESVADVRVHSLFLVKVTSCICTNIPKFTCKKSKGKQSLLPLRKLKFTEFMNTKYV